MAEKLKVLMVDDHPLILEGYKSKLMESYSSSQKWRLIIDTAFNCDEAYEKITTSLKDGNYDVVILDINIPPSKNGKFLSGEDLGQEIRKVSPETSLIVLTMYSDNLRLINILKNLDPSGFLIKSDVTPDEFLNAFKKVREGDVHYSQSITRITRKHITSNILLDENDRSILFHLSDGVRTKDLVDSVPLSLAAIEKRKKMMKEIFEVEKGGDLALINAARKMGFL